MGTVAGTYLDEPTTTYCWGPVVVKVRNTRLGTLSLPLHGSQHVNAAV